MISKEVKYESNGGFRIGIDIGGTFTDFVLFNSQRGTIESFKIPSTPANPEEAVLQGLHKIREQWKAGSIQSTDSWHIIHGSTVATNALLERKGARTALITTQGFRDVLEIRRQDRPELYNFNTTPVEPLIPEEYRVEVAERVDSFGNVLISLSDNQIDAVIKQLIGPLTEGGEPQPAVPRQQSEIESVAVVLLFSFAHPEHEQRITEKLRSAGFFASASHEILPEYREYERTSTTVVNAYVSPVLDQYLTKLEKSLASQNATSNLQIMQSNGGSISVQEAKTAGVRCILSGPAGGVVGCQYIGKLIDNRLKNAPPTANLQRSTSNLKLLTFDMGGTSTDVALIDGEAHITSEAEVGGHPIAIPLLDIHTIGAGGGSIAYIDAGGALRVGPESAGADPGPACYGKTVDGRQMTDADGLRPTVTDANVVLGRIPPDKFLGGDMPLFPDLAEAAIKKLGENLGLSIIETALGIVEIANAHMERALRVISVERGHDPRAFSLLSFGGAGGLHAADLARRLRVPRVLIPPQAATFSAFGMLAADVIKDYTQTVMLPGDCAMEEINTLFEPLYQKGNRDLLHEGLAEDDIRLTPALDMRYRGQSYELTVPFNRDYITSFHEAHRVEYGYDRPGADIEIVNLRLRATGYVPSPEIRPQPIGDRESSAALLETRPVVLKAGNLEIPFYDGEKLHPGNQIHGPAIVIRRDTTILIGKNDNASVDPYQNLILEIGS